jgi:hypothetical protein
MGNVKEFLKNEIMKSNLPTTKPRASKLPPQLPVPAETSIS